MCDSRYQAAHYHTFDLQVRGFKSDQALGWLPKMKASFYLNYMNFWLQVICIKGKVG
jgi:hypothetical protein